MDIFKKIFKPKPKVKLKRYYIALPNVGYKIVEGVRVSDEKGIKLDKILPHLQEEVPEIYMIDDLYDEEGKDQIVVYLYPENAPSALDSILKKLEAEGYEIGDVEEVESDIEV